MTILTRTVVNQIEIVESGVIQIRMEKQAVESDRVLFREYHRTALEPGMDLDLQMALVNEHLGQMGYPPTSAADIERIRRIVEVEHTPSRITAFAAIRAAAEVEQIKR